jgi:molybdopterin converting factor subunit 1
VPLELGVKLFAAVREAVGSDRVDVTLPEGSSAKDLLDHLVEAYPVMSSYRGAMSVAVNLELVRDATVLAPGDEVALIPPVGGG